MKKVIVQYVTIILAFLAGAGFMDYTTRMGNRDMTEVMAEATLPVAYVEQDGQLYNEMHGYVTPMDGSYMKDTVIGLSEDHRLGLAVEKYNADVESISYEIRSLSMDRLVESGENLRAEDDGKYFRLSLDIKDLLSPEEKYLFILKLGTEEHEEIYYYSQITYLGENHVRECVDFALEFHEKTLQKDDSWLVPYLEIDGSMDGNTFGYVNIHSRTGPVTWGAMTVEQVTGTGIRLIDLEQDKASLELTYQLKNTETEEIYQVREAFRVRYTSGRMYLWAYERMTDRIFSSKGQLAEDGEILFGIQSEELNYRKNAEENVIGFVQQGELWSYDFGQNRLSRAYGFHDGEDARGLYEAHDFRILQVEDSGSMDFLVYGYMNRGRYEGRSGVLFCRYDALMNTTEEEFFLPSDRPYQVVKDEIGALSVANESGRAWLSYKEMVLEIKLVDCSVKILAERVRADQIQMAESGALAAWTSEDMSKISLLNTRTGIINEISSESGEALKVLGFMEDDFLYGLADRNEIRTDAAGREIFPMHRIVIRDHSGNQVREFDYAEKGKRVSEVSIVENRIDLTCITLLSDGSYADALPEPITYTSEKTEEKLKLRIVNDEAKRNEYSIAYTGNIKTGSMKQPRVKMVLVEEDRTLDITSPGSEGYLVWSFCGEAGKYTMLAEAVNAAYEGMGSVWKDGSLCLWNRSDRQTRVLLDGFEETENMGVSGSDAAQCIQLLLQEKQIYTDVQASLDAGMEPWEILEKELGDSSCFLPGCSLDMVLYYVNAGAPVIAYTDTNAMMLIVGYDAQNITCYMPGEMRLKKIGKNDASAMFEEAGNLFFTYLP